MAATSESGTPAPKEAGMTTTTAIITTAELLPRRKPAWRTGAGYNGHTCNTWEYKISSFEECAHGNVRRITTSNREH